MFLQHPAMANGYMVIKDPELARTVLLEMLEQMAKKQTNHNIFHLIVLLKGNHITVIVKGVGISFLQ